MTLVISDKGMTEEYAPPVRVARVYKFNNHTLQQLDDIKNSEWFRTDVEIIATAIKLIAQKIDEGSYKQQEQNSTLKKYTFHTDIVPYIKTINESNAFRNEAEAVTQGINELIELLKHGEFDKIDELRKK